MKLFCLFVSLTIDLFQFTFKITILDASASPLKDADVQIQLQGNGYDETTKTGELGITTNKDKKFEFGSKVTITVTKIGYFAKKEEYEFEDSEKTEQTHSINLTEESKVNYYTTIFAIF